MNRAPNQDTANGQSFGAGPAENGVRNELAGTRLLSRARSKCTGVCMHVRSVPTPPMDFAEHRYNKGPQQK